MWSMRPELVPLWMGLLPRLTARSMGATRGKPPSISIPLTHLCIQTMISNFLFSNMVDFPDNIMYYSRELAKLAHMHDAFTALHISCMTFHLLVMPISQCNAQVFDCSRCLGGLAVDKRDLKAELLRFEAPISSLPWNFTSTLIRTLCEKRSLCVNCRSVEGNLYSLNNADGFRR